MTHRARIPYIPSQRNRVLITSHYHAGPDRGRCHRGARLRFRGTQGTSVIGVFGATVATTGASEKLLTRLGQLRARLGELPRDREILVVCRSAQRAYYATRILMQNGFKVRNISGGMLSRSMRVPK